MSNVTPMAEAYKNKIETEIRENHIEIALSILLDFVGNLAPSYRSRVINLCRRETAYRQSYLKGVANEADINQIVSIMLEIVDQVKLVALIPANATIANPDDVEELEQIRLANDLSEGSSSNSPSNSMTDASKSIEKQYMAIEDQQRKHWRQYNRVNHDNNHEVFKCLDIHKKLNSGKFHLESLSFSLRTGEITGIAGQNGSGKTTLLSLIRGYLAADGGQTQLPALRSRGERLRHAREKIYYISQDLSPWSGTLKTNLHLHAAANGVYGSANNDLVDELSFRYGLTSYYDATCSTLSGGYRLRYELVKALIACPKLLVLDEPLASLDLISRQELLANLKSIAYSLSHPTSIVLTTQNLYDLDAIADQVIILENGKSLYVGPNSNAMRTPNGKLFEIVCSAPKQVISAAIREFQMEIVSSSIDSHVIKCSSQCSPSNDAIFIYQALGDHVLGIRDISESARRYFI